MQNNNLSSVKDNKFDDELDQDMRESLAALNREQNIKTAKDLYEHFRDQYDEEVERKISKDLERTDLNNKNF